MFVKRLYYKIMHDMTYDWYEEVKKGEESFGIFLLHWGLWLGGFVFIHLFWAYLLYLLFTTELKFYQFLTGLIAIIWGYFVVWFSADKFYTRNRPTIDGVNDRWV